MISCGGDNILYRPITYKCVDSHYAFFIERVKSIKQTDKGVKLVEPVVYCPMCNFQRIKPFKELIFQLI